MQRIAVLALSAGLALGASQAAAQTKWDLPTAYPPENYHTQNIQQFAKEVEEATGGKLRIQVHANASLFKAPDIKRAVQTGQAQVGEVLMSNLENEDPLFGLDVVPFLASSFKEAEKLYEASKPTLTKKLEGQGLQVLFVVPWPPQGIYAKKEIASIEDMKGLKFRAYNVGTSRIAELVGAQPVTIQAAELPQALATNVVNSFISSGSTGYDSKAWETLSHFHDTQAWLPKNMIIVNRRALEQLDEATRSAVMKAAQNAEKRGWELAQERTKWYTDQLAAKGMKVLPPSPELMAGFKKIGETLTEDWIKRAGAEGQAIVEAYRKL